MVINYGQLIMVAVPMTMSQSECSETQTIIYISLDIITVIAVMKTI